LSIFR